MKILLISDVKSPSLYEYYDAERFKDIDLILSAGDLSPNYLSFLTTIMKKPLLYVHGNHDVCYAQTPPEGCEDIDGIVYNFKGYRIAGIGGCREYRGGPHQFTEKAMIKRIKKSKKVYKDGFDILLTHSPAFQLGDGTDHAHIGFESFRTLLETYRPAYMIHGHQHLNYSNTTRILNYEDTTIINAYNYYVIEVPDKV